MHDNVFIDTNLWIYLFLKSNSPEDNRKRELVKRLIKSHPEIIISNQVMNEFTNVLFKKYHIETSRIGEYLRELLNIAEMHLLDDENTFDALKLLNKYDLSFYDALIVSVAQNAHCQFLFSEDMQDGQKIDDSLIIINPFKTKS